MGLVKIDRIRSFVLQLMPMLMGKRRRRPKQTSMWAATSEGSEDNWRNIAITLTNPQNLQSLGGVMSALLANRDARTKVNSFRICMLKVRAQIGPVMSKITGQTV